MVLTCDVEVLTRARSTPNRLLTRHRSTPRSARWRSTVRVLTRSRSTPHLASASRSRSRSNGAEELGLAKAASDLGVTIQSLVVSRCGVQTWRLGAPARASHRRPVWLALERRTIRVYLA